jgi:hypothetical protein
MENNKKICPSCQSDKVRRYLYGHHLTADNREYITGDHIVDGGSPRFHCDNCGIDYGNAESLDNSVSIARQSKVLIIGNLLFILICDTINIVASLDLQI